VGVLENPSATFEDLPLEEPEYDPELLREIVRLIRDGS
jgi:hypothetical protein